MPSDLSIPADKLRILLSTWGEIEGRFLDGIFYTILGILWDFIFLVITLETGLIANTVLNGGVTDTLLVHSLNHLPPQLPFVWKALLFFYVFMNLFNAHTYLYQRRPYKYDTPREGGVHFELLYLTLLYCLGVGYYLGSESHLFKFPATISVLTLSILNFSLWVENTHIVWDIFGHSSGREDSLKRSTLTIYLILSSSCLVVGLFILTFWGLEILSLFDSRVRSGGTLSWLHWALLNDFWLWVSHLVLTYWNYRLTRLKAELEDADNYCGSCSERMAKRRRLLDEFWQEVRRSYRNLGWLGLYTGLVNVNFGASTPKAFPEIIDAYEISPLYKKEVFTLWEFYCNVLCSYSGTGTPETWGFFYFVILLLLAITTPRQALRRGYAGRHVGVLGFLHLYFGFLVLLYFLGFVVWGSTIVFSWLFFWSVAFVISSFVVRSMGKVCTYLFAELLRMGLTPPNKFVNPYNVLRGLPLLMWMCVCLFFPTLVACLPVVKCSTLLIILTCLNLIFIWCLSGFISYLTRVKSEMEDLDRRWHTLMQKREDLMGGEHWLAEEARERERDRKLEEWERDRSELGRKFWERVEKLWFRMTQLITFVIFVLAVSTLL